MTVNHITGMIASVASSSNSNWEEDNDISLESAPPMIKIEDYLSPFNSLDVLDLYEKALANINFWRAWSGQEGDKKKKLEQQVEQLQERIRSLDEECEYQKRQKDKYRRRCERLEYQRRSSYQRKPSNKRTRYE